MQNNHAAQRSMWNCDACSKSRVKCCKSIPRCSQCVRRNIPCTYAKVHKKKRTMAEHPDFYAHTNSFTLTKASTAAKPSPPEPNITFKFYHPTVIAAPTHAKFSLRPVADAYHFRWVHMLKVWCLFKPSANSPSMDAFLSIFAAVISNESIPKNFTGLQSLDELMYHPSFFPAISAYFEYANPFLPLFTERDFLSHPRSLLLVMAVWVRGLVLLPKNFCTEHFRVSLQAQLVTRLRAAYTQVSLDTVQSLLVTLNGLQSYRWGGTSTGLFYGAIVDIAHCLGLHCPPPKGRLPPHILLERRLAYSCILFIDSLQAWNMDTHCMVCVKHVTPKLFQTSAAILAGLGLSWNDHGTPVRTGDGFVACLAHTALIFQRMNLFRHQIVHHAKGVPLIFKNLQLLKVELERMFVYHMKLLRLLLLQRDLSRGDRQLLNLCRHHLDVQFHTLYHDLFTLYLKATRSPCNPNSFPQPSLRAEFANALNAAARVIKLDEFLKQEPYHMYRVQFLANAIVFIIHNYQRHPEPDKLLGVLRLGCATMGHLRTHPTYRQMATLAQTLIEKTLKLHNISLEPRPAHRGPAMAQAVRVQRSLLKASLSFHRFVDTPPKLLGFGRRSPSLFEYAARLVLKGFFLTASLGTNA
ncbi:hypothetical protein L0F63_006268 [Massospora cicadina]|nr:hypothetical protein L0F63_006268 [Massospora cicadina]